MNDDEVLTAVRDSFAGVHMRTPLDQAVSRGKVLRARRRAYRGVALAGAAAVAAVAAVTTVNLVTAPAKTTELAAWTVTVEPDHTVRVTIRQLSDAAGLQQTLRNDGIPARVAFAHGEISDTPPLPAGCREPAMSNLANAELQAKIISDSYGSSPAGIALALSPRAIPPGIGIFLSIQPESPHSDGYGWGLDLAQAAPSCTGR